MFRRTRLAFLFAGGSTTESVPRPGSSVHGPRDVEPWLRRLAELDIIADIDGACIASGLAPVGLPEWQAMTAWIDRHYDAYDGFVIVHQLATLPLAASVLTWMLTDIGKPVVVTGSSLLSRREKRAGVQADPWLVQHSSDRAGFINAAQVAVSDVGEVAAVVGNTIYRGSALIDLIGQPLEPIQRGVLGRVDFGIRLAGQQLRRRRRALRVRPIFETNVITAEYIPGVDLTSMVPIEPGPRGLFVSAPGGDMNLPTLIGQLNQPRIKSLPTALYLTRRPSIALPAHVVVVTGRDRSVAVLKFMWALGQARGGRGWKTALRSIATGAET